MGSRFRFIAGLVATAGFAFALAADVRASVCAADMEMSGSPMVLAAEAGAAEEPMPMDDCMSEHESDERAPYCPLSPLGPGSSCTSAASLPSSVADLGSSPEDALSLLNLESKPHLFMAAALFHPPRS